MEGNCITKEVHEEFARRVDAENERQNRRIAVLEDNVKEIHGLTVSVERMAVNMENMLAAIERQGSLIEKQNDRIDEIEKEPAKTQKEVRLEVVKTIISGIAGAAVVAVISLL